MIYLIGIGLNGIHSISNEAMGVLEICDVIYVERYTSYIPESNSKLKSYFNKEILTIKREDMEEKSEKIINQGEDKAVGILVGGDCLSATTHMSFFLEAKKKNIPIKIIHGSSIFTAITQTGLFLYKFGGTTTIPLENKNINVPIETFEENQKIGLHTLFLLDIKENKFMNAKQGIEYLKSKGIIDKKIVIAYSLGTENQKIIYGVIDDLEKLESLEGPQVIIIPGKLHFIEEEILKSYEK